MSQDRGRRIVLDQETYRPRSMGGNELPTMENTRDYTLEFEAVKTSFRQTKDGYHLTLVLHPNDVPQDLFSSWVGTRYQCVLIQLNDENEPVKTAEGNEADSIIQQAGMLCRSPRFQTWIASMYEKEDLEVDVWGGNGEETTARLLRHACSISSRAELRTNHQAREAFQLLYNSFLKSIEGILKQENE